MDQFTIEVVFSSYTIKTNFVRIECSDELSAGISEQSVEVNISGKRPTRSSLSASLTDWSVCVPCNKKYHRNNRKLHKIETNETSDILTQAAERHDNDLSSKDLTAKDALYHNNCISEYIDKSSRIDNISDISIKAFFKTS